MNLGLDEYSMIELRELEQQVNFDSIASKMREIREYQWHFDSDKQMRMYAHALFNRGILTTEFWSYGGILHYVPDPKTFSR